MSCSIVRGVSAEPVAWPVLGSTGTHSPVPQSRHAIPNPAEIQTLRERVVQVENDARAREERAFASGYAKGEAAGRAQEAARIESAAGSLLAAAAALSDQRRRLRRECEEDCVKLSIVIARRVLRRELSVDPEAVLGIVKAALTRIEGREVERIRVHPDDAELIRRYIEGAAGRQVEVAAEPNLERGTCIIETARGALDASVETQLAEIQRGLVDRVR